MVVWLIGGVCVVVVVVVARKKKGKCRPARQLAGQAAGQPGSWPAGWLLASCRPAVGQLPSGRRRNISTAKCLDIAYRNAIEILNTIEFL